MALATSSGGAGQWTESFTGRWATTTAAMPAAKYDTSPRQLQLGKSPSSQYLVSRCVAQCSLSALTKWIGNLISHHKPERSREIIGEKRDQGVKGKWRMTSRERFADGGYLFASCNNLQADIPLENIDAMYAAAADTDGRTLVIASAADPSLSLPFRYSVFWFAVSLSFMIGLIMKLLPPS